MKKSAIAMISRCMKHQPDDAAWAQGQELRAVQSHESTPTPSVDYLPEVQLPEEEITP